MKPTRGRNPLGPDTGDILNGLVSEHAITRSVRDSAALLDATSGPDVGDPYCAPPPARPFLQEVGADPGRLRIAFTATAPTGVPIHADCVHAVEHAAKLCADLGHDVTEARPKLDAELLSKSFLAVWSAGCAAKMEGSAFLTRRKPTPDLFEELTWALAEQGRRVSGAAYLLAVNALQTIARQIARFFLNYDVWLTPTLAEPPLPLGSFDPRLGNPLRGVERAMAFIPFTPICNATGQPAISVPLFWNEEGLPIGTHFVGRFGEESTLFRLAAQLEAARPWGTRRPVVRAHSDDHDCGQASTTGCGNQAETGHSGYTRQLATHRESRSLSLVSDLQLNQYHSTQDGFRTNRNEKETKYATFCSDE